MLSIRCGTTPRAAKAAAARCSESANLHDAADRVDARRRQHEHVRNRCATGNRNQGEFVERKHDVVGGERQRYSNSRDGEQQSTQQATARPETSKVPEVTEARASCTGSPRVTAMP